MTRFKNRIIGSGEEPLDQIQFNPRNWRIHPLNQQNALKGVLDEVGWVQEVIVNQRTGNLIDGHLRCQLAAREGAKTIPVKYVDLSEEEEALILSTFDPIAGMAATDKQKLAELTKDIETNSAELQDLIDELQKQSATEENDNYLVYDQAIQLTPQKEYVVIMCENDIEFSDLRKALNLKEVRRGGYKQGSSFDSTGTQRVIHAKQLIEMLNVDSNTE